MDRIRVRLTSTALCLAAAAAAFLPAAGPAAAAATAPAAALAGAANLGTVRLSSTSGTVDASPIFASASTSAPCPTGYGADAQLRVGQPSGPFANLARPLTSGGYDKAVVGARPNRSFTMALGGVRPVDGEWWVVVECFSLTRGLHPQRFVTEITVSGPRWRIGRPAGAPQPGGAGQPDPDAAESGAAGTVDPTRTAGAPSANVGAAADSASASTAPGGTRLAGNSGSGSASFGGVGAMLAVAGVLLIIGMVYLFTRRSPAPPTKTRAKAKTRV